MIPILIPSLEGASLRIERAARHFDEFENLFSAFRKANQDEVSIENHPDITQNLVIKFDESLFIPPSFSLPVSDCIFNLRAALDYLIYELTILDTGEIQDGTQFPIEDRPDVFDRNRRNTYVRGLTGDHVRKIRKLQPFEGCEWTKFLRITSNPDKHRRLIFLKPAGASNLSLYFTGDIGDEELNIGGEKMCLNKENAFSVCFLKGPSGVVETLNLLLVRVGETIEAFKPEF